MEGILPVGKGGDAKMKQTGGDMENIKITIE